MNRNLRWAVCLLLFPAFAWGSDGVIEINQAKALAGGVTTGDAAGFPVTLSVPGSYRLTGNLDLAFLGVGAPNTSAIVSTAQQLVSVDLNGFSILGTTVCAGSCAPTGTGIGVSGPLMEIRHGSISGMGSHGTSISDGLLEDLVVVSNGGAGASATHVRRVLARHNGLAGVAGVTISDSTSEENLGNGINGLMIERCYSALNGGTQFSLSGRLTDSISDGNVGTSVTCVAGASCTFTGNQFYQCVGNGCFTGTGIRFQIPPQSNVCGVALCP